VSRPLSRATALCVVCHVLLMYMLWSQRFPVWGAPLVGDEGDYLRRALTLRSKGFSALSDGFRPPALPMFLALLPHGDGIDGLAWMARRAQLLVLAGVSAGLTVWGAQTRRVALVGMGGLLGLSPFLGYYSALVLAETLSFALGAALLAGLFFDDGRRPFTLGLAVGGLTLLKANQLLWIALPGVWWLMAPRAKRPRLVPWGGRVVAGLGLLLLPWLLATQVWLGAPKLSTTGGFNLLLGTGWHAFGAVDDPSTLHARVMDDLPLVRVEGITTRIAADDVVALRDAPTPLERDRRAGALARRLWETHTSRQVQYGLAKVGHAWGWSARSAKDALVLLRGLVFAGLVMVLVWRRRSEAWVALASAGAGALLAFVFLPNQRFQVFFVDVPLCLCAGAALEEAVRAVQARRCLTPARALDDGIV